MFGKNSETDNNHSTSFSPEPASTQWGKDGEIANPNGIIAYIGEGVTFKGIIKYKGSVRIDGKLEGEIHTDGVLIIGERAVIVAKIEAGTIECQGHITGDIKAKNKVKLMAPAVLEGTVATTSLSMEDGVLFNGTCQMSKDGEKTNSKSPLLEPVGEVLKVR